MPARESTAYTVLFAVAVSAVCALLVSATAVGLRDRQQANALLFQQKNVLLAAGLADPHVSLSRDQVLAIFKQRIRVRGVELKTGELLAEDRFDAASYDQRRARNDPQQSSAVAPNDARIARVPDVGLMYQVISVNGALEQVVLPMEGMGMWGTMYGFLAVGGDGNTVHGITFYEQKETPGLGGEIANPKWQALWVGRKVFDANWQPQLTVIKGSAGPPSQDPHRIDGLSGATITSIGVARMLQFWLGAEGYASTLKLLRPGGSS